MKIKEEPMKKIIAVILALTMLLALAACTAKTETTTTDTAADAATTTDTAAEQPADTEAEQPTDTNGDVTTITLAMHVSNTQEQEPAVYQAIQAFQQENPDVKIELVEHLTEEHNKQLKLWAQSGELPDIFWCQEGDVLEYGENGYLLPLNDFLSQNPDIDSAIPDAIKNCYAGENGNQRVMKSITKNRDTLITNMIAFCNKYEFDGIDLDWEFPMSQDEFDAYNSFLQELKARMKDEMWNKEESTLSLALGTWALKYTPETIECIDYVNVMGYDILDQDGQHSSFFSSCVQAADYIESQGFSKQQINIGFPFYGTWEGGRMEQYAYNAITEEISPFNNFYTMKKYDTQEDRYTYFNSQAIIRDKTAYAYLKGYGGVMIFSQYCDLPSGDERSLTKAISDYLQEVKK